MRKIIFTILLLVATFLIMTSRCQAYTIQKGDTLSKIANTYYSDSKKWNIIYDANRNLIKNPNLIYPGMEITIPDVIEEPKPEVVADRGYQNIDRAGIEVKATAYDLSISSCGKRMSHPQYGITYSGRSIAGMSRIEASCIAVDPSVIPLGSIVMVRFSNDTYKKYNGLYQALDTGGGVHGNHIDLFLGDFRSEKESSEVIDFGVAEAIVVIIRRGW